MKKLYAQKTGPFEIVHWTMIDKMFSEEVYMIVQEDCWPFLYKTEGVVAFKTRKEAEGFIKTLKPHHENKELEKDRREFFKLPEFK